MTERSRFWNGTTVGDAATEAPYDADTEFAKVMASISGSFSLTNKGGVFTDDLAGLLPYINGANKVTVATGRGMVWGTWYESDASIDTTIPTPASSTRIDRLVLRKSWASATVRLTRVVGVEGGAAPALTQVAGTTWDSPLCQVSITTGGVMTITDEREFIQMLTARLAYNLLFNGGFELAQRGNGSFTINLAYTLDGWQIDLSTSTVAVDAIASTVGSQGTSARITYTHSGAGTMRLEQKLEGYKQLCGRYLSLSGVVKSTVAARVRAAIYDNVNGWRYGSYNVGTGQETLTLTAAISASATSAYAGFQVDTGTCVVEINDAMLVVGSVPAVYNPLTPADDQMRCQRYYKRFGGASNAYPNITQSAAGAHGMAENIALRPAMAVVPTVTKVGGTWNVVNCIQPAVDSQTVDGFRLTTTASGAGAIRFSPSGATDYIECEANP